MLVWSSRGIRYTVTDIPWQKKVAAAPYSETAWAKKLKNFTETCFLAHYYACKFGWNRVRIDRKNDRRKTRKEKKRLTIKEHDKCTAKQTEWLHKKWKTAEQRVLCQTISIFRYFWHLTDPPVMAQIVGGFLVTQTSASVFLKGQFRAQISQKPQDRTGDKLDNLVCGVVE